MNGKITSARCSFKSSRLTFELLDDLRSFIWSIQYRLRYMNREAENFFPLFSENKITLRRKEYIMTAIIPAKIGEMNQDDTK